jgi:hypothetical protein
VSAGASHEPRWPVALVLENGNIYRGEGFGAQSESIGEVVFNTSITGYQEIISDPSYCGQIVVMTATQIGNVGVNRLDVEARRVACAGFAIRELSPIPASWRAEADLPGWLRRDARGDHATRRRARGSARPRARRAEDGRARPRAARDLRRALRVDRADLARRR